MYIEKGTKEYRRTTLALFAAGIVTFANLYLTQPLMPIFAQHFSISPAVASLSLSVATGMLAVSLLLFGSISEAIGRKNIMALSMIGASLLTICLAYSPNFETLLVLRIIQGFIFAGVPAIAMAYLAEELSQKQLAIVMGLYISGNSIGGLSGRIIMGIASDVASWQVGVMFLGSFSLLLSIYFIWALPPSKHFNKQPLNVRSLTTSLIGHTKNIGLSALFAIAFLLMGGFVTLYNYISFKLLDAPYYLSATVVGFIFVIYLVGTFSSTWFGSLTGKYGKVKTLLAGILLMVVGLFCTIFTPLTLKIIGIVIFTFGFFGAHSTASGAVTQLAKTNKGQASSLYLFSYYIGSSICGSIGGLFWGQYGWTGIVTFIFILLALAIGCAFVYRQEVQKTI